jgi:hypothetical protein
MGKGMGRGGKAWRWRGQAGARPLDCNDERQRLRCDGRGGFGRIQCLDAERPALFHVDFCAVLAGGRRVINAIVLSRLMEVKKTRMIELHRTRMGVDERHHRLQGDEEPEHQGAESSGGHGQIRFR